MPNSQTKHSTVKRILFLDDHIPYPELGVGYPRARSLILALHDAGHAVTFVPLENPHDDRQSARRVLPSGVELVLEMSPEKLEPYLASRSGQFDLIFVSRPNNMRLLLKSLRKKVPILYDAEAIFSSREILQRFVEGCALSPEEQTRLLEEELALARAASHVTAVNESDAALLRSSGCESVSVISNGFSILPTETTYRDRKDVLFVGAQDDDPSPNVDAVMWFVSCIWPRILESPDGPRHLWIAGRCAVPRIQALAGPRVSILGKVAELRPLYERARVFIAPHRYAAGIPTKVLEAAAHGVPCVISDLLAIQLGWRNGVEAISCRTASDFAEGLVQLYSNEELWESIRSNALRAIGQSYSDECFRRSIEDAIFAEALG